MNDTVSVLCYGHYFQVKRLPTESCESVHRRLWWIITEWFRDNKSKTMDQLWLDSFRIQDPDALYDFDDQDE